MKYLFILPLLISCFSGAYGQSYAEFSPLSGRSRYNFSAVEVNGSLFYCLRTVVNDSVVRHTTYKLQADGQIIDSISNSSDGIDRWGWISAQGERIFFHGIRWVGSVYTNIRHSVLEYNQQLEQVGGEIVGTSLTPATAFITYQSTGFITMTQMSDFHLYNDTILTAYQFLMVDSPFVALGRKNFFLKMGLDGTLYVKKEIPVNELYNVFFANNKMYVQGSTYVSPFVPRALSEFDSNGDLIRGIDYDTWGSGEFLEGSLGLWHKGQFYLTYVGKDDNLPGCATDNAAIDVRDSTWAVLHRFKLPDCGYYVSGKTPFAFDTQDNVYYVALDAQTFRKIIVYKFSPDFQIIWKKELDFSGQPDEIDPATLLTTSDGGLVVNSFKGSDLSIIKISATGDVVSSTSLPLSNENMGPVVYPNPTVGPLRVLPAFSAATVAQVASINGRPIGVFDLRTQQIDLSTYPPGVYAISLWDAGLQRLLGTELVVKQ